MLTVNEETLSETDITMIDSAIRGMYRDDRESRQLCHIASYFGSKILVRYEDDLISGTVKVVMHGCSIIKLKDEFDPDVLGFDLAHISD